MYYESALNAMAQQYLDLTLNKSRYDEIDIQWFTEGPFWRRTSMNFSRDYKILPDYEIADLKHGKSLKEILAESEILIKNLESYRKTARPEEMRRVDYILSHVVTLNTRARMMLGEQFEFNDMTDKLYNLVAPEYDYQKFDAILEKLDHTLPGTGSVLEKIADFRQKITIPQAALLTVLKGSTQAFHDMSMANMSLTGNSMPRVRVRELPDNMEFLSILFGYDYNHLEYERNFNSLYPWTADKVVECIGHEMEPGHITYYEKRTQTYIDTCWPEMAVVSQYSASSAFTEGSARYVISMCFNHDMAKQLDFERELIFKPAGLDEGLLDVMPLWHEYAELAGYGKLEASRNLWDKKWTLDEAAAFLKKYGFITQNADAAIVNKLALDAGHFVSHDYARDVVKAYFQSKTSSLAEEWKLYEELCSGHMSMYEMDLIYKSNS